MAYDVLDNVYSIFMDVKTGVGGSSGSNTFYNTDVNTSFIEIILTERDKNLTMTDYTYIVSVDKADGTSYVNRYTASEANKMSIKLDTQLLACEGECTAQLYVLKDDKVRTMMEFNYFVKNGVFDGAKPPSHNEDSIYISLMKEFTDLKENVLIAIGKMDGIESSIESVKNIADTNTNTINSEKKKTEANTSTIEGHTRSISEINNTLQTHSDKIQASEETITQHTEKLQGHDRKLEEYNTTIQEHGRTLESQGASITEQGEKISKNETDITQNKKDIKANTAEINKAKTATTGEKFGSVSERIDAEVSRINNKIEVSFVPQEEAESHTILNTVEGMSTDMIVKGRTLQNLIKNESYDLKSLPITLENNYFTFTTDGNFQFRNIISNEKNLVPSTEYTIIYEVKENTLAEGNYVEVCNTTNFTSSVVIDNTTKQGIYSKRILTKSELDESGHALYFSSRMNNASGQVLKLRVMLVKGNLTDIPEYFEGIKSFGEQEDKISILSTNAIKIIGKYVNYANDGLQDDSYQSYVIKCDGVKSIAINLKDEEINRFGVECWKSDNFKNQQDFVGNLNHFTNKFTKQIFSPLEGTKYIKIYLSNNIPIATKKLSIEVFVDSFPNEGYREDKKDILLSELGFDEGLRGLNNTVYDELNSIRDVAIKRVFKYISKGNETITVHTVRNDTISFNYIFNGGTPKGKNSNPNFMANCFVTNIACYSNDVEGCFGTPNGFYGSISKAKLESPDMEGITKYVRQNFKECYYEIAQPVETPLTDPINVKIFNEKTYVSFINALKGTSSFKTPVDSIQTIARLTSENKSLLSSNVELDAKVTEAMKKNQQLKEEAIATQSALDYILMNTLKA